METLLFLGTSLGFGAFSGLNLYLATFMTGLAIRFHFIEIHEHLHQLDVLASPWIIGTSGVIAVIELFADKIPGFDSLWDSIHTFIRPVGAIAVSLGGIGTVTPEFSVLAALLTGTASLTTHTAKMGTRLVANASPEPISNFVLSTTEDVVVGTGILLLLKYPFVTAGVCFLALIGLWVIIPKIFRKVGGVFKALKAKFSGKKAVPVE